MPTDLPPDYEPPSKKMLDRGTYLSVLRRLTRRAAGPVGLLWGLSTLLIVGVTLILFAEAAQWSVHDDPPDLRWIAIVVLVLMVADIFRKALYRPLRRLGRTDAGALTIYEAARLAAGRMLPVLVIQFATSSILVTVAVVFGLFGIWSFIPVVILSFVLAPAVYFSATGSDATESLEQAVSVARRHGPWVLGVPAAMMCIGALVESVTGLSLLAAMLVPLEAILDGGGVGLVVKALTLSLIYGYVRWLSVGAVYVAIDEMG